MDVEKELPQQPTVAVRASEPLPVASRPLSREGTLSARARPPPSPPPSPSPAASCFVALPGAAPPQIGKLRTLGGRRSPQFPFPRRKSLHALASPVPLPFLLQSPRPRFISQMDAVTATSTAATSAFGGMEPQKFDLAALLKNVAAAAAASSAAAVAPVATMAAVCGGTTTATLAMPMATSSTATSPNSVESSASTNGAPTASPSPPHSAASVADMKPISAASLAPPGVYQRRQLPFTPIKPSYAPSGHGRQILVYDSRSHPGRRREFAYKTRFTNQSGLTTVYYRCMACRALRHRLQRVFPKDKLPAVPCIAVKNDLLINDPDFPDASDHFCSPLTIEESNQRLQNTFERGHKRARMKMASTAVEETIRKVGRLNAAAAAEGGIKAEEESEDGGDEGGSAALQIDLWTKSADATTTSSGLMELSGNGGGTYRGAVQTGGEGSDCSSDSLVVDVLKDQSPDEELLGGTRRDHMPLHKIKEENGAKAFADSVGGRLRQPLSSLASTTATTSKGSGTTTSARSPRKKLDALLKLAEMRAAATANGGPNGKEEGKAGEVSVRHGDGEEGAQQRGVTALLLGQHQHKQADNVHPSSLSNCSTSSSSSSSCRGHSGHAIQNLQFNSLGSLLTNSSSSQFPNALSAAIINQNYHQHPHHQSPTNSNPFNNNNNNLSNGVADSIQSIQAIASRLSRGGATTGNASELSKALDGKAHQQQQKGAGLFVNGNWEKPTFGTTNPMMMMMGTAHQQQNLLKGALVNGNGQQQQMMVGELLKKYVENNAELATSAENMTNSGGPHSRNSGELACAMFMAQMVENAELRQEVQKLRAELDSLKALVAAAAVVGTNNGFDNGGNGSNGLHRHIH
uniref:Uncharacterized protein n=1 Tax=Globodera rostochiensis TaxID=31243 RepID=A0A914HDJ5_GLORO